MINISDLLYRQRRNVPGREAIVDVASGRRLTYRELDDLINQAARAFQSLGVMKGDRVGILLRNGVEFVQTFMALARLGAISVPLNWRLVADELEFQAQDSGVEVLIYDSVFADAVTLLRSRTSEINHWLQVGGEPAGEAICFDDLVESMPTEKVECNASGEDILYLLYTSGTTGRPKGSMHTHDSAFWAILSLAGSADYRQEDRYYVVLPLFHAGALIPSLVGIYRSMTLVIERDFNPQTCWKTLQDEQVNITLLVPAMLLALREEYDPDEIDLTSLRWIMSGAAPVPAELIHAYQKMGISIVQVYGLTEAGGPACGLPAEKAISKAGSTGQAMYHADARLIDAQGNECPAGVPGEIEIRGPHVMKGYWNLPKATEEVFNGGWLRTGDIGVTDEEGFITIVDRLKDMIVSGGENIYPAELENVLVAIPGVLEAGVIGVPSEKWGESPLAVIVSSDSALTEQTIIEYCRGKLAGYKRIAAVRFVDALPRNASGKILKNVLREQFQDVSLS